jgi:hypothetical protein
MGKTKVLFFSTFLFVGGLLQAGTITVTMPAMDDTWYMGFAYSITWTYAGFPNPGSLKVNIRLRKDGAVACNIANNISLTDGSYSWPPSSCAGLEDGSYTVRVCISGDGDFGDSGIFKIGFPWIQVLSPHGGEVIKQQHTTHVQWISGGVSSHVRVDLLREDVLLAILKNDMHSADSFTWKIDTLADGTPIPPGTNYRVQVQSLADSAVVGRSGLFTIAMYVPISVPPKPLPPIKPKLAPDLVVCLVTELWVPIEKKRDYGFAVKNIGNAPAAASVLRTWIDGKGEKFHTIKALAPGESDWVEREEIFYGVGVADYHATADPFDTIAESSNGNNRRDGKIHKMGIAFVAPPSVYSCSDGTTL